MLSRTKTYSHWILFLGLAVLLGIGWSWRPAGTTPNNSAPGHSATVSLQDEQPENAGGDGVARFEKKLNDWREVIIEMQILRQEYYLAPSLDESIELKKKYDASKKKGDAIIRELKFAAAQAYRDKPREATDYYNFLVNSLGYDLEVTEDQEVAFAMAQAINTRTISRPDIARRVGLSHYLNNSYDVAEKLLTVAANSNEQGGEDLKQYIGLIPRLRTLWEKEVKAREADSKTKMPRAIFETTKGKFVVELYENDAPNTVKNFVSLAKQGFYDDLAFFQVLPFRFALTGSPNSTASGSPGYVIKNEGMDPTKRRPNFRGTLCTPARKDDKGLVAGSIFIISLGPYGLANTADYCNFGRVVDGMEVVDMLERSHDQENKEVENFRPDKIIKVTVENLREDTKYEPEKIRLGN